MDMTQNFALTKFVAKISIKTHPARDLLSVVG